MIETKQRITCDPEHEPRAFIICLEPDENSIPLGKDSPPPRHLAESPSSSVSRPREAQALPATLLALFQIQIQDRHLQI